MVNKILLVFVGFDVAFLLCAVLHLIIPLYTQNMIKTSNNVDNVATNILLDHCPLLGMIISTRRQWETLSTNIISSLYGQCRHHVHHFSSCHTRIIQQDQPILPCCSLLGYRPLRRSHPRNRLRDLVFNTRDTQELGPHMETTNRRRSVNVARALHVLRLRQPGSIRQR